MPPYKLSWTLKVYKIHSVNSSFFFQLNSNDSHLSVQAVERTETALAEPVPNNTAGITPV
jgi:hypothetical protein